MQSSVSWSSTSAITGGTWRTNGEEPIKSTGGVLTKDPLKVKSVTEWFPTTLKVWELGNSTYLEEEAVWCLYSGIELTKISWM